MVAHDEAQGHRLGRASSQHRRFARVSYQFRVSRCKGLVARMAVTPRCSGSLRLIRHASEKTDKS